MRKHLRLLAAGLGLWLMAQPAQAQQKEVTVWSWFIASTMQKSIAAFEKAHPDIKVKYTYYNYSPEYLTALKAAAASGSLPDIIGLQPGAFLQQYREHLDPLNERAVEKWGANWQERIFPVNRKQMLMGNPAGDENFYMMPQESQVLAIWYNRKLFEKAGASVPKTYAELVEVVGKLKAVGVIPMFQGAAGGWQNVNVFLMIANQRAPGHLEKAQAGEADWTTPEMLQSMKDWKALFDDGVFQNGALGAQAYPTGAQLFAQGRIGMMALGSWWMQESKFPPPLSPFVQNMDGFDFFYLPALPGSDKASPPVGGIDIGYGLTKNGAKNDAAWTFLTSLVDGEGLQEALNDLNDLPALTGHEPKGEVSPHIKQMFDRFMADLPAAHNQRIGSPAISDALENALAGVASGTLEPQAALEKVQEATKAAYKK